MARSKKSDAVEPLMVRVPKETSHVIHSYMTALKYRSIQELLRPVLEDFADACKREPEMQAILQASAKLRERKAAESRARKVGKVARIDRASRNS